MVNAVKRLALARKVGQEMEKFRKEHPAVEVKEDPPRLEELYEAVDFVDSKLPGMAHDLFAAFQNQSTPVVHKIAIFKVFASFAMTEARLARGMGLVKELAQREEGVSIGTLLQIDLSGLRELPARQVTERLLEVE
jgi:hypothetical protein